MNSVDISKEDTPVKPESELENLGPRRLEEKFAVLNTGIYECRSCGYKYDEAVGDPSYPLPPGYQFEKLPDDWRCPTCGAAQSFFQSKSVQTPDRWVCAEPAIWAWWQFSHFGPEDSFYIRHLFFFSLFLGGYFLQ